MSVQESIPRKRIHPQKFAMWIAIGSMIMMFGGFTSGYIVRRSQGNWTKFDLPIEFWISTFLILISSISMIIAVRSYKKRSFDKHKNALLVTVVLGTLFSILQVLGFYEMHVQNIRVNGNPSGSFLYVIAGAHVLHVLGGIIALLVQYGKAIRKKARPYDPSGIEIVATYWHFVDILWLYLFFFFLLNR